MVTKNNIFNIDLINKTKEDFKTDIDYCDFVLSFTPNDIAFIHNKGKALCLIGRLEEGIKLFDQVLKLKPQDIESHFNKGLALNELRKYDEAIESFEKSILFNQKSSPTYDKVQHAQSYNGKGMSLAQKKDLNNAIKFFNLALSIDSENLGAINNRSVAQHELGMFDESFKGYNQIASNKNHENEAYQYFLNEKGSHLLKNNRFSEAIDEFNKAIAFKKDTADYIKALDGKAEALFKTEKYDEALIIYDQLIKKDQNNKRFYHSKGNIYVLKRDFELALKSYKKAISIDSNYTQAIIGCANCLNSLQRLNIILYLIKSSRILFFFIIRIILIIKI